LTIKGSLSIRAKRDGESNSINSLRSEFADVIIQRCSATSLFQEISRRTKGRGEVAVSQIAASQVIAGERPCYRIGKRNDRSIGNSNARPTRIITDDG
jgi:hypothetical protein